MNGLEKDAIRQVEKIISSLNIPRIFGIIHFEKKDLTLEEELYILHALQDRFPTISFELCSSSSLHKEPDNRDYI